MSRWAAADRFGGAASTAAKWLQRVAGTGSVAPGRLGGHRPRTIAGAHHDWLLERCRSADFTLRGLVRELAERGLKVDTHSVWDFVHAEGLTHKKRRWSRPSSTALMSRVADHNGSPVKA